MSDPGDLSYEGGITDKIIAIVESMTGACCCYPDIRAAIKAEIEQVVSDLW